MSCKSKCWPLALALLCASAAGAADRSAELGVPLAEEQLQQRRAGQASLELNVQETRATLQGNKAVHTVNGDNTIGGGAFHAASGFPLAVQNTGNNVIIQNAFIINLDMQ